MTGGTINGFVSVGSTPGYNVTAVEDIKGNGYADIVIQNASGQLLCADMTGGTLQGQAKDPQASVCGHRASEK
jgi:hypothetical protein